MYGRGREGGGECEFINLESCGPFPHPASRHIFVFTLFDLLHYGFYLVKELSLSLSYFFSKIFDFEFSLGKCRVCQ